MTKRRLKTVTAVVVCIITAFFCAACANQPYSYYRRFSVSGFEAKISLSGRNSAEVAGAAFGAMESRDASVLAETGAVAKFNSADGEIFEGEENILGERDLYVRVEVDRYVYSAVKEAKELYDATDETFSISMVRLRKMWRAAEDKTPSDDDIYREIAGVQNPLLITEKIADGKFYLEKGMPPQSNENLKGEHTLISFDDMAEGILCDAAAKTLAGAGAEYAEITVGGTGANFGRESITKNVALSSGAELCSVRLDPGCFVSVADVYKNSHYLSGGLFVGGIINPADGCPTSIKKIMQDTYVKTNEYPVAAAVITDGGSKACAFAQAACIKGENSGKMLTDNNVRALIFTSEGRLFVVGDIEYSLGRNEGKYEIIKL